MHALDVKTGAEKPGSPITISGSVSGTGDGSSGGTLTFDPKTHMNRAGLLYQAGVVYIAFASHCDLNTYHGWLFAYSYDGTKLTQTHLLNVSPNGRQGGIWQSGIGLSADDTSIYFVAGNGSTNPNSTPRDLSESVVRLGITDFATKDFWTPSAYSALNAADSDISSGAILMPHNLLLTGSKDGRVYVIDSTNLGKFNQSADAIIQTLTTPGKTNGQRGHLHGGPIYYNAAGTEWVYLWPEETQLIGYKLDATTRKLQNLVQGNVFTPGHPGGFLSLSSNNGKAGTGILWGSVPQVEAWHVTAPGTLFAVDATDISKVLWSSEQNATRDKVGNFAKMVPPLVANGRVYLATFSNTLRIYGLLN